MNESAVIEVRELTMAYGGRLIMEKLSFQVREGEIFVIMGGSGGGKSTLLKHLIGLKRPAAGEILFDGEDVSRLSDDQMSRIRNTGVPLDVLKEVGTPSCSCRLPA